MRRLLILRVGQYYYLSDGFRAIRLVGLNLLDATNDAKNKQPQFGMLATRENQIIIDEGHVTLRYVPSFQERN